MKWIASDLPNDQPIAKLKRKQSAISQKSAKKHRATSTKQLKSLVYAAIKVYFFQNKIIYNYASTNPELSFRMLLENLTMKGKLHN
jgi:hypothetical protein